MNNIYITSTVVTGGLKARISKTNITSRPARWIETLCSLLTFIFFFLVTTYKFRNKTYQDKDLMLINFQEETAKAELEFTMCDFYPQHISIFPCGNSPLHDRELL